MNLDQFKKEQNKLSAALEKHSRAMLVDEFKSFFEANPNVTEVAWSQYTPYFNDGDECVFSRHDFSVAGDLSNDLKKSDSNYADYDIGGKEYYSEWSMSDRSPLKKSLKELERTFSGTDDVFRAAFGDHVEVVATRTGFKVEECEHE